MKRKIALLTCTLLLCGCNSNGNISENTPTNDIAGIAESIESAEGVQTSAEATQTSPALTVPPAVPTDEPENEYNNSDWITPRLSSEKVTYTFSNAVNRGKIVDYAGYDIDFDMTTLDYYDFTIEDIENRWSGEELEEIRARNYMWELFPRFCYMGTEEADWIAQVDYCMFQREYAFLTRLFLIKDGEIVRELEPIEDDIGLYYSFGELYITSRLKSLRKMNAATGKTSLIFDDWRWITAANKDYIFCDGVDDKIIVRATGEIIDTDISFDEMMSSCLILSGDKIDYTAPDGEPYRYDISTRTLTKGDFHNLEKIKGSCYNDKWSATFEKDTDGAEIPAVRVVDLYDGSERVYDLRSFDNEEMTSDGKNYGSIFLDGDRLWIETKNFYCVLNLQTNEAAETEAGLTADIINYISEGKIKVYRDDVLYAADVDYPV